MNALESLIARIRNIAIDEISMIGPDGSTWSRLSWQVSGIHKGAWGLINTFFFGDFNQAKPVNRYSLTKTPNACKIYALSNWPRICAKERSDPDLGKVFNAFAEGKRKEKHIALLQKREKADLKQWNKVKKKDMFIALPNAVTENFALRQLHKFFPRKTSTFI